MEKDHETCIPLKEHFGALHLETQRGVDLAKAETQRAVEVAKEVMTLRTNQIEKDASETRIRVSNLEKREAWVIGAATGISFVIGVLSVVASYLLRKW